MLAFNKCGTWNNWETAHGNVFRLSIMGCMQTIDNGRVDGSTLPACAKWLDLILFKQPPSATSLPSSPQSVIHVCDPHYISNVWLSDACPFQTPAPFRRLFLSDACPFQTPAPFRRPPLSDACPFQTPAPFRRLPLSDTCPSQTPVPLRCLPLSDTRPLRRLSLVQTTVISCLSTLSVMSKTPWEFQEEIYWTNVLMIANRPRPLFHSWQCGLKGHEFTAAPCKPLRYTLRSIMWTGTDRTCPIFINLIKFA